jgi:hypothetical protein
MMNPTRRCILKTGSKGLLAATVVGLGANATFAKGSPQRANKAKMEKWMSTWMDSLSAVGQRLELSRFKDPTYFLLRPISWYPNASQAGNFDAVTVPTGFVTDFASIPQIFWSILRPDGDYAYAAAIHDWLYWDQARPRHVADQIFALAMQDFRIDAPTLRTLYNAVWVFGGTAWDENKKLKQSGEKRILTRFPEDPTITWSEWKKNPGNF